MTWVSRSDERSESSLNELITSESSDELFETTQERFQLLNSFFELYHLWIPLISRLTAFVRTRGLVVIRGHIPIIKVIVYIPVLAWIWPIHNSGRELRILFSVHGSVCYKVITVRRTRAKVFRSTLYAVFYYVNAVGNKRTRWALTVCYLYLGALSNQACEIVKQDVIKILRYIVHK